LDDASINRIKKAFREITNDTEEEFIKWWETKHPYLGNNAPCDMVKTAKGFKKLEIILSFSPSDSC
jgi:hypothetical protein